ncbi:MULTISPECIES: glycosyltransferase family 9 protein [Roseivirga]|nr:MULTISPECIES: glycosyltransferase family 9 protein [Roseivirga]MBO6660972.1 glycosyltransferase family 9 protein [Roseivirga sp.]MBO6909044.1 glycosyltransferase family 9 protein [Roseivirga sp.]WPZ11949.1 glycosyltransferase family 9 protein [Roseivirga spongicola]
MRTNWKYSFKSALAINVQRIISIASLWYFKYISQRKVTFVRRYGIGDVIMSTYALSQFRNEHPETDISIVTNYKEVFDDTYHTTHKLSWTDFPVIWLMYEHYDFWIWRKTDRSIPHIISEFIGYKSHDNQFQLSIHIDEKRHARFLENMVSNKKYIVIQPYASHWNSEKNWSTENWQQLISRISNLGYQIYHLGLELDPLLSGVIDLRGRTSLEESFLLIKYSSFFLGVNSFGEQAAGAFSIPSIILYGPTNPVYSLNPGQTAIYADEKIDFERIGGLTYTFCQINQIRPEFVFNCLIEKLNLQPNHLNT